MSLTYLKELVKFPDFNEWGKVRTIAADALSRGVPQFLSADWKTQGAHHTEKVNWVEYSRSGRWLASASDDVKQLGSTAVDLGEVINYGFLGSMRRALAVPILWSIDRLQRLTGSYGIAIILFTIFIYSLFFPLKWQSSRKMKKAQKYAPRMKALQEQLKGMKQSDPRLKELQMEQLRLM